MDKMFEMMKSMMVKLETLDEIKERILCVEKDVKQMKDSIEFVHAEVNDLKDEDEKTKRSDEENRRKIRELEDTNQRRKRKHNDVKQMKDSTEFVHAEVNELKDEDEKTKRSDEENRRKIHELEDTNRRLQESVVDLKPRSMRDNLLFFNVKKDEKENTTEKIYDILEQNLEIFYARSKVKIDCSHRVGRKRVSQRKPRAIVVKFNYFQDREQVRQNARKLKGSRIGIAEQFPEEIEKIRQTLHPEMKKAKAQGHRVRNDVLSMCWKENPEDRPDFQSLRDTLYKILYCKEISQTSAYNEEIVNGPLKSNVIASEEDVNENELLI
ncbi:Hypothetical predicted protein [Paramuricea clavata]|uniref:Uncharacterized protein n=1 Tax=Paramuricea clavata TaxID=317549 RepID=A0A7D9EGU5_PARCT|nr:Hypothetical predicted protein [Paramuricea clavata]